MQKEEHFEENEIFVVENKEAIEKLKMEILEEFFKTQNINIEERAIEKRLRNKSRKISNWKK